MTVAAGTYEIGPSTGRLLLRTFRQGVAARVGHDLVLEARGWQGRVAIPDGGQPTVEAEVDLRELHVVEGTGGIKPLTEGDKADIRQTLQKQLRTDRHSAARFSSSSVEVGDDEGSVDGTLTLAGQTQPIRLDVHRDAAGTVRATATVTQSRWGIKPYSGFLGALKLRDDVEVEITVTLARP